MKITFYHSSLCPRCYMARKSLYDLTVDTAHIAIEEVDILAHPFQTWKAGIRIIPAITIDQVKLSGLYLRKNNIASFISSCEEKSK